jgi:hypothetical protein
VQFSQSERYLFQFQFSETFESDMCTSNILYLKSGGTLQLFIRSIPSLSTEATSVVLGIKLESSCAWIVRVVALSGRNRIELKSGSTRADILRVPTSGRGTWSDLLPIERNAWNDRDIFLVELIYSV